MPACYAIYEFVFCFSVLAVPSPPTLPTCQYNFVYLIWLGYDYTLHYDTTTDRPDAGGIYYGTVCMHYYAYHTASFHTARFVLRDSILLFSCPEKYRRCFYTAKRTFFILGPGLRADIQTAMLDNCVILGG